MWPLETSPSRVRALSLFSVFPFLNGSQFPSTVWSLVLFTEGQWGNLLSSDYKPQEPYWHLSNTMLQMHLESLKHSQKEQRTHPERPLQTLLSLQNPLCSRGFSLTGKQWIHTNTSWKIKTMTETKSKAGANLAASRSLVGQAGCDRQGCHPMGSLRGGACLPDYLGFRSTPFLDRDAWVFISLSWDVLVEL